MKKSPKKFVSTYVFLFLLTSILCPLTFTYAEDVKITTYYPSPYGNYKKLQVEDAIGLGQGTAALPSFSFTTDTNTGMWSSGADTLDFSTGGTERLKIDSSGNVGVGLGAVAGPSFSFLTDTNTGMWSSGADTLNFSTAGIERLRINSSGNLGVGLGAVGGPSHSFLSDSATGMWSSGTSTLNFSTAGTERVRIDSAGNMGIGTTAPSASALLELSSTTKGFFPPRMTTPPTCNAATDGLVIYNSTVGVKALQVCNGTTSTWTNLGGGGGGGVQFYEASDRTANDYDVGTATLVTTPIKILMGVVPNPGSSSVQVRWTPSDFFTHIRHVFINTQRYTEWTAYPGTEKYPTPGWDDPTTFKFWTEKTTGVSEFMVVGE